MHALIVKEDKDGTDRNNNNVEVRMLVGKSQVGCLMGKKGDIMKKTRDANKSVHIKLSGENLPACAFMLDEVLQVGDAHPPA